MHTTVDHEDWQFRFGSVHEESIKRVLLWKASQVKPDRLLAILMRFYIPPLVWRHLRKLDVDGSAFRAPGYLLCTRRRQEVSAVGKRL